MVQGANDPDEHARITPLLLHRQLPLTPASAARAGDLSRELRSQVETLATADLLQAGTCLELGLPLATKNGRHFSRIPGLEVLTPS
jgi:tRNA(fMet)-specific endonuclease VapC